MNLDPSTAILTGGEVPSEPPTRGIRFLSMADFLALPVLETPWIVDHLLPAGGTSLISAKPRVGKSTFVRDLALSVARGEPFLGRKTHLTPVAYLCLEEITGMVQADFIRIGARPDDPIMIHTGDIDPMTSTAELEVAIRMLKPGLVIVDTLGKFLPIEDFNDYGTVNKQMARITAMLRQFPLTHLMYIHHSKKSSDGEDDYLGSVAFHGNVDVFFRMFRSGSKHFIQARQQRYNIDLEQTELVLDPKTSRLAISTAPDKDELFAFQATTQITDAIRSGKSSWREIREVVKGNNGRLAKVRDDLLMSGTIILGDNNELKLSS